MASKKFKKLFKIALPVAGLAAAALGGGAVAGALMRVKAKTKKMKELKGAVDVEKVFKLKGKSSTEAGKTPTTSGTLAASAGFRLSPTIIIVGLVLLVGAFLVMKK